MSSLSDPPSPAPPEPSRGPSGRDDRADDDASFGHRDEVFARIFEAASDAMSLTDLETGHFLTVNRAFEEQFGFDRRSLTGKSASDIGLWAVPAQRVALLSDVRATGRVHSRRLQLRRADGAIAEVEGSADVVQIAGRACLLMVGRDVTARCATEEALRLSEERFAKAFHAVPDALALADVRTGTIIEVNEGFLRLHGYERADVIGRSAIDLDIPTAVHRSALLRELAANGAVDDLEAETTHRDGTLIPVSLRAEKMEMRGHRYTLWVGRDLRDRRRAEEARATLEAHRLRTKKVEALGSLAGGIAHDFNNILTAILAFAELVQLNADDPQMVRDDIAEVLRAGHRASALVQQILTYSHPQKTRRAPIALAALAREVMRFLRPTLPRNTTVRERFDDQTPLVLADPTQLHQVLMNLCTNAVHAMEAAGGTLSLELGCAPADDPFLPVEREAGSTFVRLRVGDTGVGMSAETLDRLYVPFFTTKAAGKGTGLGLPVAQSIVLSHGGSLHVESQPGLGTTFDVYLPAVAARLPSERALRGSRLFAGGHSVLFVDDEGPICGMAGKLLTRLGYRVETFTSPLEALARFEAAPESFDVVVTDLTMPALTGVDLARSLLARRPTLPVLLVSGFRHDWTPERLAEIGIRELLDKPFSFDDIAAALERALRPADDASDEG